MKSIAITATGESLDASVGPRFARERFIILVDPDTMEWEAVDNLPNLSQIQNVGIQVASFLARRRIKTVVTGNCGAKAFQALKDAGIKVILNTKGTVRDALEKIKFGDFVPAQGPNVH
jgi:predicted Fe-Mo cluster-binding NifX family protein